MILYGVRRLALAVPLLLGMSVLIFALMRLVPGDPAVAVLGYKATPEGIRALREAFHLDEPVPQQYLRWLGAAARGDFGHDFRQNEPIGRMILDRLPVTLELTLLAALCTVLIGVPLGLLAGGAARRSRGSRRARGGPARGLGARLLARHHADPGPLARRRPAAVGRVGPVRGEPGSRT